jgi:hypothetical protein
LADLLFKPLMGTDSHIQFPPIFLIVVKGINPAI